MNFTVSQWLQIIAIAVSAAIPISRWVWDARRQSRIIQPDQTTNEVTDIPTRHKKRKEGWVSSALPFFILGFGALSGGELTKFDFGIMMFAVILIVGNWILFLSDMLVSISDAQLAHTKILKIIVEAQLTLPRPKNEENEQGAAHNGP